MSNLIFFTQKQLSLHHPKRNIMNQDTIGCRRPFRFGMGLARRGQIGQAGHRHGAERRQPDVPRHEAADVLRRMGACLLHRLPQPSRRRRRRPLGSHRLEGRRRPLRKEIRVCFCWKCRLRFSGRHFLLCCRQTFRARPFAVAGAEYTGRGSLLSAGPVSGVLPESGYGCF